MKTIITIGRQFGSAGKEIGEKVAAKLGVICYDKELLKRAANESGMCPEIFESNDERPTNSFLYNLVMDTYSFGFSGNSYVDMPISHKVFLAQFDSIKKLAEEGPCVIVGRCADYALSERDDVLNVFIYGNMDTKVKRIQEIYDLNESQAKDMIIRSDKKRANYYNYYSSKKWGNVDTYDVCLNSSVLGIDGTVDMIVNAVMEFEKNEK